MASAIRENLQIKKKYHLKMIQLPKKFQEIQLKNFYKCVCKVNMKINIPYTCNNPLENIIQKVPFITAKTA